MALPPPGPRRERHDAPDGVRTFRALPAAPVALGTVGACGSGTIALNWTDTTPFNYATGFTDGSPERHTGQSGQRDRVPDRTSCRQPPCLRPCGKAPANATSYNDTTVPNPGTPHTYSYHVIAYNVAGDSSPAIASILYVVPPTVTFTGAPGSAAYNTSFTVTATTNSSIMPAIAGRWRLFGWPRRRLPRRRHRSGHNDGQHRRVCSHSELGCECRLFRGHRHAVNRGHEGDADGDLHGAPASAPQRRPDLRRGDHHQLHLNGSHYVEWRMLERWKPGDHDQRYGRLLPHGNLGGGHQLPGHRIHPVDDGHEGGADGGLHRRPGERGVQHDLHCDGRHQRQHSAEHHGTGRARSDRPAAAAPPSP